MKRSNTLILGLIVLLFIATLGAGIPLKNQFEKIDQSDPFFDFTKTPLKDFKYIRLHGNYWGGTQIVQAPISEIKTKLPSKSISVTWEIVRDTLIVRYQTKGNKIPFNSYVYQQTPNIVISSPNLSGVSSDGIIATIANIRADSFQLKQIGYGSDLKNNEIKHLSATMLEGANLTLRSNNKLMHSQISAHDSSSLQIDSDVFQSVDLKADNRTTLTIPGSMLKKVQPL